MDKREGQQRERDKWFVYAGKNGWPKLGYWLVFVQLGASLELYLHWGNRERETADPSDVFLGLLRESLLGQLWSQFWTQLGPKSFDTYEPKPGGRTVLCTILAVGSFIWRLRSHLDNERFSIIHCRDKIRAVRCTVQIMHSTMSAHHLIHQFRTNLCASNNFERNYVQSCGRKLWT